MGLDKGPCGLLRVILGHRRRDILGLVGLLGHLGMLLRPHPGPCGPPRSCDKYNIKRAMNTKTSPTSLPRSLILTSILTTFGLGFNLCPWLQRHSSHRHPREMSIWIYIMCRFGGQKPPSVTFPGFTPHLYRLMPACYSICV